MSPPEPSFNPVFIATHHKGGTVWINSTFRRISKLCHFPFIHLNTGESGWQIRPDKRAYMESELERARAESARGAILVDYHGTTPDTGGISGARGVHITRDPRDMLLSAIRYHEHSKEPWLDHPLTELGGKSFREKLLSYPDDLDRVRFELDTYMGVELRRMGAFAQRPDFESVFQQVKYEDLIQDEHLQLFHAIAIHLGFRGQQLIHAQQAFWSQSLFGGMRSMRSRASNAHIRDGSIEQWRRALSESTRALIESSIGDVITGLGYPDE